MGRRLATEVLRRVELRGSSLGALSGWHSGQACCHPPLTSTAPHISPDPTPLPPAPLGSTSTSARAHARTRTEQRGHASPLGQVQWASSPSAHSGAPARQLPGVGVPAVYRGFAASAGAGEEEQGEGDPVRAVKKLVHRSQQRGILELDLLLGRWAESNEQSIVDTPVQRRDLTTLLEEESPDLLKWLLGQLAPPDHVAQNSVFKTLRADVESRLKAHTHPHTFAQPGAEWVKGWGDIGRPGPTFVPAPPAGNQ